MKWLMPIIIEYQIVNHSSTKQYNDRSMQNDNATLDTEVATPQRNLSISWNSLGFLQINCKLELYLSRTSDCVITEVLNATAQVGPPEVAEPK